MKIQEEDKDSNLLLMVLAVCFGFILYIIYELSRPSKGKDLASRINNGFGEDSRSISSYWSNIRTDLQKAYQKMSN